MPCSSFVSASLWKLFMRVEYRLYCQLSSAASSIFPCATAHFFSSLNLRLSLSAREARARRAATWRSTWLMVPFGPTISESVLTSVMSVVVVWREAVVWREEWDLRLLRVSRSLVRRRWEEEWCEDVSGGWNDFARTCMYVYDQGGML